MRDQVNIGIEPGVHRTGRDGFASIIGSQKRVVDILTVNRHFHRGISIVQQHALAILPGHGHVCSVDNDRSPDRTNLPEIERILDTPLVVFTVIGRFLDGCRIEYFLIPIVERLASHAQNRLSRIVRIIHINRNFRPFIGFVFPE